MTLDNEVREKILSLPNTAATIFEDWEKIADEINSSFEWSGSKIKWENIKSHKGVYLGLDYSEWNNRITRFILESGIETEVISSNEIYYLNDSAINFSVKINPNQFHLFVNFAIENIPQHHYFFEREKKWCLVVSCEGYADFGFSKSMDNRHGNPPIFSAIQK